MQALSRTQAVWLATAGILVAASLGKIAYVLHALSVRFVNEDQASVLLAARELLRLRVHQPSFPGQHYGVFAEGLPAAALHLVGVSPLVGLTATLALLWYGGWLLLARAAWHAGARATALLAAGVPVLVAVYPVYYPSVFATGAGRFLAVAAAVLLWRGRGRAVPVGIGLAALAVVADPSVVILLVAGAALGMRSLVEALRRQPLLTAAACAPAVAWAVWRALFARAHPDHGLHAAPAVTPSWDGLREVAGRAAHYADVFSFAALPGGGAGLLAALAVVVACLLLGDLRTRIATLGVVVATALVAATPRALDDVSAFLPGARLFLALPYAVVLLLAALESRHLPARPAAAQATALAVGGLLAVSAVAGLARAGDQAEELTRAAAVAPVVPLVPVEDLERRCRAADALARDLAVDLVVYLHDRTAAYGCPVLQREPHATLLPSYERRTWRLYAEQGWVRERLAVVPGSVELCTSAQASGLSCRTSGGELNASVIETDGTPTLAVLRRLGIEVRPFGPGCTPAEPATCP